LSDFLVFLFGYTIVICISTKSQKKIPTNNQTKYKKTPTTTEQKQNQKQLIIRSIAAYICVGSLLHVNNNFIARMALSYLNWSSFRYKNK
jgi:hypothetical protein